MQSQCQQNQKDNQQRSQQSQKDNNQQNQKQHGQKKHQLNLPQAQQESTIFYFRKTCEQIEQQISTILANMSVELIQQKIGEPNQRSIEKYINSVKLAVIRSISCRLSQILNIEQRYQNALSQVNEELELQRNKMKQVYAKYQSKILQNDSMKVEILQLNQTNDNLAKQLSKLQQQNAALQNERNELRKILNILENKNKNESKSKMMQTDNVAVLNRGEYEKIEQQLEQRKEQRELYHNQLTLCNAKIQELLEDAVIANERIRVLQAEYEQMFQQKQLEIAVLLQKSEKSVEMEGRLQMKNHEIEELKVMFEEKEREGREKERQYEEMLRREEKEVKKLEGEVQKMKNFSKCKVELQDKYTQKIALLTAHIKQLAHKIKHLQSENDRLYQAMDHYASNQLKINHRYNQLKSKSSRYENQAKKWSKAVENMRGRLLELKGGVQEMKKQYLFHSQRGIISLLKALREQTKERVEKLLKKMAQFPQKWGQEEKQLKNRMSLIMNEYKQLQQRCFESEMNSGKVAGSMLELKSRVFQQEEMIRCLKVELSKEKQFNEGWVRKLGLVVKKYEKYNVSAHNEEDFEINQLIEHQKSRYRSLQEEYQKFIQN